MSLCNSENESRGRVIQQTHRKKELRSEAVYTAAANKQRLSSLTKLTGLFETDIRALFGESLNTIATNSLHGHTPREWQKTDAPASMGSAFISDLALLLQHWELFSVFIFLYNSTEETVMRLMQEKSIIRTALTIVMLGHSSWAYWLFQGQVEKWRLSTVSLFIVNSIQSLLPCLNINAEICKTTLLYKMTQDIVLSHFASKEIDFLVIFWKVLSSSPVLRTFCRSFKVFFSHWLHFHKLSGQSLYLTICRGMFMFLRHLILIIQA